MITQKYAKQLFDCIDGHLVWKVSKAKRIKIGDNAGTISKDGYVRVFVDGKSYLAHKLVYLIEHGDMPTELDHIDRNKLNNDVSNLRPCTRSENSINRSLFANNKTGIKNVHKHSFGKYQVSFRRNNKHIYCGLFDDLELAELVAIEAVHKVDSLKQQLNGA
jgi:hypothetical protein